jgi:hypothetical protein
MAKYWMWKEEMRKIMNNSRIEGTMAEIRTRHFSNTIKKNYRLRELARQYSC